MMGGYSAPPAVHSSLDRVTEAETIIVTSQRDMLRRNHGTRPGSGVGQPLPSPTGISISNPCPNLHGYLPRRASTVPMVFCARNGPKQVHESRVYSITSSARTRSAGGI